MTLSYYAARANLYHVWQQHPNWQHAELAAAWVLRKNGSRNGSNACGKNWLGVSHWSRSSRACNGYLAHPFSKLTTSSSPVLAT